MALAASGRRVRCREIEPRDLDAVAALLTRAFHGRAANYWRRGLHRQATRPLPDGYPRFGYLLEAEARPVGVILLMFSERLDEGGNSITCNVSSWYVEPEFRSQGALLTAMALKHKHVTYINVTPAPATWPIIEAQGFRRYCSGLFLSLPVLSPGGGYRVQPIAADAAKPDGLSGAEFEVLVHHASYGCLSLVCHRAGSVLPFVLTPFRIWRGRIGLGTLQLAYCRGVGDFVACAGAIGRFLLRRGIAVVIIDANGPISGLPGFYTEAHGRKYFRGPHPPRLADLTETELVLYGY